MNNLDAQQSMLLIIDIQTKLSPAINNFSSLLDCALKLVQGSNVLSIPIMVTEQYPQGLGCTHPLLKKELNLSSYFNKTHFSACNELEFLKSIASYERPEVVVIGTEAHVCVLQTCLDLLAKGFKVVVAADAIGSRNKRHKKIAIEQMRDAGAIISSVETIIFQWTKKAATSKFKEILKIIK